MMYTNTQVEQNYLLPFFFIYWLHNCSYEQQQGLQAMIHATQLVAYIFNSKLNGNVAVFKG